MTRKQISFHNENVLILTGQYNVGKCNFVKLLEVAGLPADVINVSNILRKYSRVSNISMDNINRKMRSGKNFRDSHVNEFLADEILSRRNQIKDSSSNTIIIVGGMRTKNQMDFLLNNRYFYFNRSQIKILVMHNGLSVQKDRKFINLWSRDFRFFSRMTSVDISQPEEIDPVRVISELDLFGVEDELMMVHPK